MSYQVGQAIIIYIDSADNGLFKLFMPHGNCNLMVFITRIEGNEMLISDIDGITGVVKSETQIKHLATEAEILAEAVKHGWELVLDTSIYSPKEHHKLIKINNWLLNKECMKMPNTYNLKKYCEEGLRAHQLITALNLAK